MDKDDLAKGYLYETILGVFEHTFGSLYHLPVGRPFLDDGSIASVTLETDVHLPVDTILLSALTELEDAEDFESPVWRKFADAMGEDWLRERLRHARRFTSKGLEDALLSTPTPKARAALDAAFAADALQPQNLPKLGTLKGFYIELRFPMDARPASMEVPIDMALRRLRRAYEIQCPDFVHFDQMVLHMVWLMSPETGKRPGLRLGALRRHYIDRIAGIVVNEAMRGAVTVAEPVPEDQKEEQHGADDTDEEQKTGKKSQRQLASFFRIG